MPDSSPVADAQPAASSPAADPTAPVKADALENLSEPDLQTWRMTGALPDSAKDPTPPADSSPATADPDQPASTDAPRSAASEPAKPKTEARMQQLLAERAQERARADRAEARARELEARTSQPQPDARSAASSPAPAGKPDPEAFTYGTSDPGYLEALTDWRVSATLSAERQQWEQAQQQARRQAEQHQVLTAFEAKVETARASHPDFDAVAMLAPSEIQPGTAADLWVLEDEAGAEILYHLQQSANVAERRRILALNPREQLKELVRLGDRLTGAAPAARGTGAPPPPHTLSSRATPGDPVERALAADDTGAYIAAMNARDLARLKR